MKHDAKEILGNFVNGIECNNPVCSYSCDRQRNA